MKYKGINHIALATGDMDKTVRFWRDLLGMRLIASHGGPGHRQYFFAASEYDLVAFFEWSGTERVPYKRHGEPVKGPFAFDHLAFGVESEDDLWAIADRLIAANFACSDMIDHGLIRSIYTYDPNGVPLEFTCYTLAGLSLAEHPILADKGKGPAALEGPEPNPGFWPPVTDPFTEDEKVITAGEGNDVFKLCR